MRAESVAAWRESILRLPDQHFFDLMRLYLGAIKTPFNKQKLLEELAAFLRRNDTRERMLEVLDPMDLLVLSAVRELPVPSQGAVIDLFRSEYSFAELYERILNLEERLVIYRRDGDRERVYAVNPWIEEAVAERTGRSLLIAAEGFEEPSPALPAVDSLTLAGIYSFFLHGSETVKNDGGLKKRTLDALGAALPRCSAAGFLETLVASLSNIGLLVRRDGALAPDSARWEAFAALSSPERRAYLAAAAMGRTSRERLRFRAADALELASSLESGALYRVETVSRLAALLSARENLRGPLRPGSRLASIIGPAAPASETPDTPPHQGPGVLSDLAAAAAAFGFTQSSEGFVRGNPLALENEEAPLSFVVSPSFTVTLMPGAPLSALLPLARFLEVEDIQTAARFSLSRSSVTAAFDQGMTADEVAAALESGSAHGLPGNVRFSLDDWYRSWSSASLFHGYVLRADESRRLAFEKNPRFQRSVRKLLAPGVWLLEAESEEEVREIFSDSGIDPTPSLSQPGANRSAEPFGSLPRMPAPGSRASGADGARRSPEAAADTRAESLRSALEALDTDEETREALRSRIDRKIVLFPEQLDPGSVKAERVEARGMDFLGKVRIAEYAIASGSLLELALDEGGEQRLLLGRPVSTEKRTGDVTVKLVLEPERTVESVSLGRAVLVRRIRGSIFAEPPSGRP